VRFVILDADGVLYNTQDANYRAFLATVQRFKIICSPREIIEVLGLPLEQAYRRLHPFGNAWDCRVFHLSVLMEQPGNLMVHEGVSQVLGRIPLAAVYSYLPLEITRARLRAAGLGKRVPLIAADEEVPNPRPHPRILRDIVDLLQAEPGEVLFVTASLEGIRAGKAAGVATAGALWGGISTREDFRREEPAHILESFSQISDLL
jgi:phosphoglycolate phosphatase-like HAD superfamily hydrolase